jgi:hypothetical protein
MNWYAELARSYFAQWLPRWYLSWLTIMGFDSVHLADLRFCYLP